MALALGGFAIDLATNLIGDALSGEREIVVGPCPGSPSLSAWITMWRNATPEQRAAVQQGYIASEQETRWGHGPFRPETEEFIKIAFGGDDCKQSPNNLKLYNPVLAIIQSQGGSQVLTPTTGDKSLGTKVVDTLQAAGTAAVTAATGTLAGAAATEFNQRTPYEIVPEWVIWAAAGVLAVLLFALLRR